MLADKYDRYVSSLSDSQIKCCKDVTFKYKFYLVILKAVVTLFQ